jgi:hypothetical protein
LNKLFTILVIMAAALVAFGQINVNDLEESAPQPIAAAPLPEAPSPAAIKAAREMPDASVGKIINHVNSGQHYSAPNHTYHTKTVRYKPTGMATKSDIQRLEGLIKNLHTEVQARPTANNVRQMLKEFELLREKPATADEIARAVSRYNQSIIQHELPVAGEKRAEERKTMDGLTLIIILVILLAFLFAAMILFFRRPEERQRPQLERDPAADIAATRAAMAFQAPKSARGNSRMFQRIDGGFVSEHHEWGTQIVSEGPDVVVVGGGGVNRPPASPTSPAPSPATATPQRVVVEIVHKNEPEKKPAAPKKDAKAEEAK